MDFAASAANTQVFQDMLAHLKKSAASLPKTRERMMSVTGVSWSDDRMVKVVVGPRGQLVGLEIDPRVFRNPNAAELSAKILGTAENAVRKVSEQMQEIMTDQLPPDMAEWRAKYAPDEPDHAAGAFRSDAEIHMARKEER